MSEPIPQEIRDAIIAKLGDGVHFYDTPESQHSPPTELSPPSRQESTLEPPNEADYWRSAYVYTVNAPPGDNFSEQGGRVYIVLVHSGSSRPVINAKGWSYHCNVTMKSPPSESIAVSQLPTSGDNLAFSQSMQMFKNNGNETFTFPAEYNASLGLEGDDQQRGSLNGTQGVQWALTLGSPRIGSNYVPFKALSVLSLRSHALVTLECEASVYGIVDGTTKRLDSVIKTITVDCRF
ncbi:hypothetical protein ONZ45_g6055 [Pleurotus djamor]|nr:hypothetical protein ONZ45_g6055 [Pleurotus djamor]